MCPPGYQISKDLKENRWRVLHSSGTKSKSYGKNTRLSDFEAMKWLLLQCWRQHKQATGESCPIDWEKTAMHLGDSI